MDEARSHDRTVEAYTPRAAAIAGTAIPWRACHTIRACATKRAEAVRTCVKYFQGVIAVAVLPSPAAVRGGQLYAAEPSILR